MDTVPAMFADLRLLRPQWLWALAALPVLGWWWRQRRARASAWRTAVDPHLLPHLLEPGADRRGRWQAGAAACAYVLAVLALAGPSWEQVAQPAWRAPAPLVVALDLSSATTATDLPPSRLLQARAKLATLLERRTGGQVGLVAFADDAYTVAPLTADAANVALFLDALDPSVMPVDGQRVDRAIAWSARLLRQAGFGQGDILVLTDHADAAAIAAAAEARAAGYRVSALGLGTAAGAAHRQPGGGIGRARLDAGSLQALAEAGGGRFAPLAPGVSDLQALDVLAPRSQGMAGTGGDTPGLHWQDGGFWLLPLLLLLALPVFRRGGALAAVLVLAWLPVQPAAAFEFEDLWQRPAQQAHEQLLEGAEAYREGDYARAAEAWRGLPDADAQYNLGNALARAGEYEDAIDAYDRALAREPGMADARANRAAVQALLDRRPPPSGGEGDPGEDEGEGRKGQSAGGDGGQPGQDPGAQAGDGTPREPTGGNDRDGQPQPQGTPEAPDPAQAEAQRAADAAQRARMADALEDQSTAEGEAAAVAEPGDETDAEREQRIANAAWLQRVPDDPGGLLRRKFSLEHQRRQREGRP